MRHGGRAVENGECIAGGEEVPDHRQAGREGDHEPASGTGGGR